MKISEDLKQLHLHDGNISNIHYSKAEKQLTIHLRQCDWEEEDDGEQGKLVSYGVDQLETSLPLDLIEWDDDGAGIRTLEYDPSKDSGSAQGVKGWMVFYGYPSGYIREVLEISFLALEFKWIGKE